MDLVPLNMKWTESTTKLDLKAVYMRQAADGKIDLLHAAPLRRHNDTARKGWTYLTLASREDVAQVLGEVRQSGVDMAAINKSYDLGDPGAFKIAQYLAEQGGVYTAYVADLQAKVDKFGADAVVELMRVQNPAFVLPEDVKVKKAKAPQAVA